jgi:hypothetical protein
VFGPFQCRLLARRDARRRAHRAVLRQLACR